MASPAASGGRVCKHCGEFEASPTRQYLELRPLCLHELPPHSETTGASAIKGPTLVSFLKAVLAEAYKNDFESHTWIPHGQYPTEDRLEVIMPPLTDGPEDLEICVPVQVEKRVNGNTSSAWLARRSHHHMDRIAYSELDTLLAQDHCRKEALYTPSVFDANELLKWNVKDLRTAVEELDPKWKVRSVQMSIHQMFHEMPKALGFSLLQNRVFHVLCITAHSTYDAPGGDKPMPCLQSHTLQLPVSIKSLQGIPAVKMKSHIRPNSQVYDVTGYLGASVTARHKRHIGSRFTEGIYVSLERLMQAPSCTDIRDSVHRWDMMTKSDAKGISRLAPWSTKKKETLQAVSKDVLYVLEHIRRLRQVQRGDTDIMP